MSIKISTHGPPETFKIHVIAASVVKCTAKQSPPRNPFLITGVMVQRLRVFATLEADPVFSSLYPFRAHNHLTLQFQGSGAFFRPQWALHTCGAKKHADKTLTHTK